jgi:spoIIIJ-associated protein
MSTPGEGDAARELHGESRLSPAEELRELLEAIAESMGLEPRVEVDQDGELLTGTLSGDDLGLFIGHHGHTIDAVQHVAQRVILQAGGTGLRVVVDAAGYRERRADVLRSQADRAAEEALRASRPVELEPMTSTERRFVHEYLRERGGVETYSEGDEPERRLVVAPPAG